MRFVEEFRDPTLAHALLSEIRHRLTRPWVIMEICGGHTHAIMKHGIDQLLPPEIELVHGPGCPVCVTPLETIDRALTVAQRPELIFTSFGDMLRVPGSTGSLLDARAAGADVRMVYSPLEALALARQHPEREVVFFAVGFETTTPANAMALLQASREAIPNFSLLASQFLVIPAIRALLSQPANRVQAYLAPGHVCTVMGLCDYEAVAEEYRVPIVATGFEPVDILAGILMLVRQLEEGVFRVENQYGRSVKKEGNPAARQVVDRVFRVSDRPWRGMGVLPASGLVIRDEFAAFDAERKFAVTGIGAQESELCLSGEVLQGQLKPDRCPAFGRQCTPEHPLGATMVSGEGACAAYYRYQVAWGVPAADNGNPLTRNGDSNI